MGVIEPEEAVRYSASVLVDQLSVFASLQSTSEERQETAQNLKLMAEAREAMENMFKSHAADALRNNNQSFLELAKATLAEFQQGARGDLEKRQMAIDQLVGPVRASLEVPVPADLKDLLSWPT